MKNIEFFRTSLLQDFFSAERVRDSSRGFLKEKSANFI